MGQWSEWGACTRRNKTCGYKWGLETRTRHIVKKPPKDTIPCPTIAESRMCKMAMRHCRRGKEHPRAPVTRSSFSHLHRVTLALRHLFLPSERLRFTAALLPLCFSQSGPCSTSQLFFFFFFRGLFPTISFPLLCGILQKYNLQVSSMAVSVSSCQLERFLQYAEHVCQANMREVDGISLFARICIYLKGKPFFFLSQMVQTRHLAMRASVSGAFKINALFPLMYFNIAHKLGITIKPSVNI